MSHNRDLNACTTVQTNFAAVISYKKRQKPVSSCHQPCHYATLQVLTALFPSAQINHRRNSRILTNKNKKSERKFTYKRNIKARSSNNCCRGEAVSIARHECVFVASVTQHAERTRRILSGCTVFFHIISQTAE